MSMGIKEERGMLLLRYIDLLSGLDAQTTPTFSAPGEVKTQILLGAVLT